MSKSKTIPSRLLSCVREEDKKRFKQDYYEANFVLDVMKQAVEKEMEAIDQKLISNNAFDKPAWSEYQANLIGHKRALTSLLNLFPTKE